MHGATIKIKKMYNYFIVNLKNYYELLAHVMTLYGTSQHFDAALYTDIKIFSVEAKIKR